MTPQLHTSAFSVSYASSPRQRATWQWGQAGGREAGWSRCYQPSHLAGAQAAERVATRLAAWSKAASSPAPSLLRPPTHLWRDVCGGAHPRLGHRPPHHVFGVAKVAELEDGYLVLGVEQHVAQLDVAVRDAQVGVAVLRGSRRRGVVGEWVGGPLRRVRALLWMSSGPAGAAHRAVAAKPHCCRGRETAPLSAQAPQHSPLLLHSRPAPLRPTCSARMSCWKKQRACHSGRRPAPSTNCCRLPPPTYSITIARCCGGAAGGWAVAARIKPNKPEPPAGSTALHR